MTKTALRVCWHQQGKAAEAQQMLAKIYNWVTWFTEGIDTADLQTERTLLAEWAVPSQNIAQSPKQRAGHACRYRDVLFRLQTW